MQSYTKIRPLGQKTFTYIQPYPGLFTRPSSQQAAPAQNKKKGLQQHKELVLSLNNFLDTFHQMGQFKPLVFSKKQADISKLNYVDSLILKLFKEKKELQEIKPKRVEEKQKMFFKKGFKYVENQFFSQKHKKKKIQKRFKNYGEFYDFYFKVTSGKFNIPLANYHHPQKSTLKNSQQGCRSFNQVYIDLILASDSFRKEIKYYLNDYFIQETVDERNNKIDKFVGKCYKIVSECEEDIQKQLKQQYCNIKYISKISNLIIKYSQQLIKQKLEDYIIKNPKCKIPWSVSELQETQMFAQNYIDNFENQLFLGNLIGENNGNKQQQQQEQEQQQEQKQEQQENEENSNCIRINQYVTRDNNVKYQIQKCEDDVQQAQSQYNDQQQQGLQLEFGNENNQNLNQQQYNSEIKLEDNIYEQTNKQFNSCNYHFSDCLQSSNGSSKTTLEYQYSTIDSIQEQQQQQQQQQVYVEENNYNNNNNNNSYNNVNFNLCNNSFNEIYQQQQQVYQDQYQQQYYEQIPQQQQQMQQQCVQYQENNEYLNHDQDTEHIEFQQQERNMFQDQEQLHDIFNHTISFDCQLQQQQQQQQNISQQQNIYYQ